MCGVFSRSRSRNKSKDSGEEAGSTMSFDNDFSGTIVRMPRLNEPAPDFHAPHQVRQRVLVGRYIKPANIQNGRSDPKASSDSG